MHSYDLIRALKDNYDGEEIYVVGINCDDTALLRKGVDAGYVVPRITEESYIPTVIDICEKEKVDVILPFITAELPIMAENRELLESHGVKVSISSMEFHSGLWQQGRAGKSLPRPDAEADGLQEAPRLLPVC